jgi:hypothetical protein
MGSLNLGLTLPTAPEPSSLGQNNSCLPSEVHVSLEQEWAVVRGVGREGLEVACTLITPRIAMARQTDVLQLQVVDCLTKALEVPPVNAIVVLVDLV